MSKPFILKRRNLDFNPPGDTGFRAVVTVCLPCRENIDDQERYYFFDSYWRPEHVMRAWLQGYGFHVDEVIRGFQGPKPKENK